MAGLLAALVSAPAMMAVAPQAGATFPVIVVFDDRAPFENYAAAYAPDARMSANPEAWDYQDRNVVGAVQALEAAHRFSATNVYSATIRGFAARLTTRQIAAMESHPMVRYVEADGVMAIVQGPPPGVGPGGGGDDGGQVIPWGIQRIGATESSTKAGDGEGSIGNVNAYIIDTGVDAGHRDLNVVNHVNFASGPNRDCNGHGTHVAGTVAARDNTVDVVGVAPGAPLTGVKVLGCGGTGTTSGVIQGVDWVTANAILPATANMSLGGGASQALDDAV
ncbi:MAG TPA: S8 family serine peptidase, partial [Thermomicrobiales bacterium]|nr:S8 family serine peptidase [Thermomicrobiales bacterium]